MSDTKLEADLKTEQTESDLKSLDTEEKLKISPDESITDGIAEGIIVAHTEDKIIGEEIVNLVQEESSPYNIVPKADDKSESQRGFSSSEEVNTELDKNSEHQSSIPDSSDLKNSLNEDISAPPEEAVTTLDNLVVTDGGNFSVEDIKSTDEEPEGSTELIGLSSNSIKNISDQDNTFSPPMVEDDSLIEKSSPALNSSSDEIIQKITENLSNSHIKAFAEDFEKETDVENNLSPTISKTIDNISIVDSIDTFAVTDNQINHNAIVVGDSKSPTISSPNFPESDIFQEAFVTEDPIKKAESHNEDEIKTEEFDIVEENVEDVLEKETQIDSDDLTPNDEKLCQAISNSMDQEKHSDSIEDLIKEDIICEDISNIVISEDNDSSLSDTKNILLTTSNINEDDEYYGLKPVNWWSSKEKKWFSMWILTQNENGPCPLIALSNILILRGQIVVTSKEDREIKFSSLIQILADHLVSRVEHYGENPEIIQDVLSILPSLRTGLDVNVGFHSIRSFGQTKNGVSDEIALFGAFGVELVHGWVPDRSEDEEAYRVLVLGPCKSTYNGAMDFLVTADAYDPNNQDKDSSSDFAHDALVVSNFLEQNATQLTYHGLTCLSTTLPNDYLCVLFRNNHFLTLYKRSEAELYLLVTDSGFGQSDFIVWESLQDVDQVDSQFFTSNFTLSSAATVPSNHFSSTLEKSDHDLAVSLQKEEEMQLNASIPNLKDHSRLIPQSFKSHSLSAFESPDLINAPHRRAVSQQPPVDTGSSFGSSPTRTSRRESDDKKDKQCVIS